MPLRGRVAAALFIGAGALALVLSTVPAPAAASSTTITVLAGTATVTNAAGALTAASGDLVRTGDQVRTSSDGHAVLTFVDGSTMVIEPGASLVLEEATIRQGSVAVRVFQTVGLTWSSVSRHLAPGSRFDVRTPAITATVRGTAFEVEVSADGKTRVRTSEGTVTVSNDEGEVIVGEGAETTAEPDEAPAPPSTPPPSTSRVLEIGARAILIVDATGRGCGLYAGKVVQQIPGCVVRDGSIEIRDTERLGGYRLAVTEDVGSDTSVIERTTAASPGAVETVRVLDLPTAELGAAPIQVASGGGTTTEVTLPLIGTIPVQMELTTAQPVTSVTTAPSPPRATVVPQLPLAPTPLPATTPTAVAPTVSPVTLATPGPLPSVTLSPVPTLALLRPTPTPAPTLAPTPTPTPIVVVPSLLATATPSPSPAPSSEPTPTSTPVPPPAAPASLSATPGTVVPLVSVTIDLSWSASSSADVARYEIYRSVGGGGFTLLNTSLLTSYSDVVIANGTYAYKVRAVAADSRTSEFSNTSQSVTITL